MKTLKQFLGEARKETYVVRTQNHGDLHVDAMSPKGAHKKVMDMGLDHRGWPPNVRDVRTKDVYDREEAAKPAKLAAARKEEAERAARHAAELEKHSGWHDTRSQQYNTPSRVNGKPYKGD